MLALWLGSSPCPVGYMVGILISLLSFFLFNQTGCLCCYVGQGLSDHRAHSHQSLKLQIESDLAPYQLLFFSINLSRLQLKVVARFAELHPFLLSECNLFIELSRTSWSSRRGPGPCFGTPQQVVVFPGMRAEI